MLYKTQGIIIKRTNLAEFDRLLGIYTREFGKILVRAKAVRKNQSKLKGHLELFLYSHFLIAPGRNLDIITGAETIERFPFIQNQISCLAAAQYLSEIVDKVMAGPEKDPDIWQLVLTNFQELNQPKPNIRGLINDFENNLLGFLGYGFQAKPCLSIESILGEPINSKAFLQEAISLVE